MTPLAMVNEGEAVEIVGMAGKHRCGNGGHGCGGEGRLAELGLRPGRCVEIVRNTGGGPLLLRLEEAYLALGRGVAMQINVRRKA